MFQRPVCPHPPSAEVIRFGRNDSVKLGVAISTICLAGCHPTCPPEDTGSDAAVPPSDTASVDSPSDGADEGADIRAIPLRGRRGEGGPVMLDKAEVIGIVRSFDDVEREGFHEVRDLGALPNGDAVQGNSLRWASRVFSDDANPYARPHTIAFSWHGRYARDTLRYAFTVEDAAVVAFETRGLLLIRVAQTTPGVLEGSDEARRERIVQLSRALLRTEGTYRSGSDDTWSDYRWEFVFPEPVREGAVFSTAPDEPYWGGWCWVDRVDAGVHHGQLFFLIYKIEPRVDGRISFSLPSSRGWFDPAEAK